MELTLDEKKYLNKVSVYIKSHGFNYITFKVDDFPNRIDTWEISTPQESRSLTMPSNFQDFLVRLYEDTYENFKRDMFIPDDINYENVEIIFDTAKKQISIEHNYWYYSDDDSHTIEFELADDDGCDDDCYKELIAEFDEIKKNLNGEELLHIDFDGGGDSGYIESSFTNGINVPEKIEQFCYQKIEDHFSGWENNEGAYGSFEVDLKNEVITLNFTYRSEETDSELLSTTSFDIQK